MIEKWLEREIARGLQGLLALRLVGAPADDSVTLTLDIWLAAIQSKAVAWLEHEDTERIRRAFRHLYGACERWPPPKLLLDHLGNRDPPRQLPAPRMNAQERAKNRARLAELIGQMNETTTATRNNHEQHPTRILARRSREHDPRRPHQAD